MWCAAGKGEKIAKICPVSLGLAIGIVSFCAVLIWTVWILNHGMSPMMAAMHMPVPTFYQGFVHALMALVKGFIFGFFVALLYDLISCSFKGKKSRK